MLGYIVKLESTIQDEIKHLKITFLGLPCGAKKSQEHKKTKLVMLSGLETLASHDVCGRGLKALSSNCVTLLLDAA